jgi:putative thioredoxin
LENSRKGPVLVDFWADWAGPSLRQREMLLRLADEYGGRVLLVTVNTDREKDIARELGIKSIPSCKLFRHGKPVEHVHGMQTEADYRGLIERHLTPVADQVQAAAIQAWQAGDRENAIQILAEGALGAPEDPAIPLLLAKLLIQEERHDDAHAVLKAVPDAIRDHGEIRRLFTHLELIMAAREAAPREELEASLRLDPLDCHARLALAAQSLIRDEYSVALEQLAELDQQDPEFRDGLPRRALKELLQTLGPDDERARRFRQKLFDH